MFKLLTIHIITKKKKRLMKCYKVKQDSRPVLSHIVCDIFRLAFCFVTGYTFRLILPIIRLEKCIQPFLYAGKTTLKYNQKNKISFPKIYLFRLDLYFTNLE